MESRRDVYQAIADPTRREIINMVAAKKQNLSSIASNFNISRQAISLHIKILEECDLIEIENKGRERICKAKLNQLREVHDWTEKFKIFWNVKLDALEKFLDHQAIEKKTNNYEK